MQPQDVAVDDPFLLLAGDALTTTTRKQRRALLASGATSLTVFWTGIIPENLPSLGITQHLNRRLIVGCLTAIDLYFLTTFVVYWLADYWGWERRIRRSIEDLQKANNGSLKLEEAIELAMTTTRFERHSWHWVRCAAVRARPLLRSLKLRATANELKDLFSRFTEGKIGILQLVWTAAPPALARLMIDGWVPIGLGAIATTCMVVRYYQMR